jgi:hypothetical protein
MDHRLVQFRSIPRQRTNYNCPLPNQQGRGLAVTTQCLVVNLDNQSSECSLVFHHQILVEHRARCLLNDFCLCFQFWKPNYCAWLEPIEQSMEVVPLQYRHLQPVPALLHNRALLGLLLQLALR